jgi:hypothetical protein
MENNSMGNKQEKKNDNQNNNNIINDDQIKIRERTKSCDKIGEKSDSTNRSKLFNSQYFYFSN